MSASDAANLKIAQNVRKFRKAKGLSHDELQELTGFSYGKIINIETGNMKNVSIEDIETIADALDVNMDDIVEQ